MVEYPLLLPVPFNTMHSDSLATWDGTTDSSAFRKLVDDITQLA
jgi:hypothetical protein